MVASQLEAVSSTPAPHALVFAGWPSNPSSKPSQLLEAASSPTDHWGPLHYWSRHWSSPDRQSAVVTRGSQRWTSRFTCGTSSKPGQGS